MRIAIVKLSALGDIIHAMVALQLIKAHDPTIEIDWIVEERFSGVLEHNPDISRILTINLKALKADKFKIFDEINKVRTYASSRYDLVIDAQGLLKSALTARLLGRKVTGFDKHSIREKAASWFYDHTVAYPYHENTIDRNAAILSEPLGFTISPAQILAKKPFLYADNRQLNFDDYFHPNRHNIVFVIGSTWPSRNYPPEKFIKIAQALQKNCLVVWGNTQEKSKAEWMAAQCANIKVMPLLNLNALKAVIGQADLVIGNDTGPTHMAWGLNVPSITIFGPTPINRVYQTDINKTVKSESTVNPFKLDKNDFSIKEIDEKIIISQAQALLSTQVSHTR